MSRRRRRRRSRRSRPGPRARVRPWGSHRSSRVYRTASRRMRDDEILMMMMIDGADEAFGRCDRGDTPVPMTASSSPRRSSSSSRFPDGLDAALPPVFAARDAVTCDDRAGPSVSAARGWAEVLLTGGAALPLTPLAAPPPPPPMPAASRSSSRASRSSILSERGRPRARPVVKTTFDRSLASFKD